METIEIKSIQGTKKTITVIVDGVQETYPAQFKAKSLRGAIISIKFDDSSIRTIIIDKLSKLKVNGQQYSSLSEAVVAINELSFNEGGSSSENNGGGGVSVSNHNDLPGRYELNCHPITSITDLELRLERKQLKPASDNIPKLGLNGVWIDAEHDRLLHRDAVDSHPIEAITGLGLALSGIEEEFKLQAGKIDDAGKKIKSHSDKIADIEEDVEKLKKDIKTGDTPSIPSSSAPLSTTPHLWKLNTEIDLGDGSFGARFKGIKDGPGGEMMHFTDGYVNIVDSGGYVKAGKIAVGNQIIWSYTLPLGTYSPEEKVGAFMTFFFDEYGGYFTLNLNEGSSPQLDLPYDVWVRYTK